MARTNNCWQAAATYDATNEHATFVPNGLEPDMWQVRVINASGSNAATVAIFTVDEDNEEVELELADDSVEASSGQEYTIESKNPKLRVKITGTSPNVTAKVKAWSKYNNVSQGRPYPETEAATGGVTLTGDDTLDSF